MGIPASNRLRKPREFQGVRSLGHRIHCGPFIFQCHVSESLTAPRLGIVTSRRVGKAVKRNYLDVTEVMITEYFSKDP